jgi:hypothetical protein
VITVTTTAGGAMAMSAVTEVRTGTFVAAAVEAQPTGLVVTQQGGSARARAAAGLLGTGLFAVLLL